MANITGSPPTGSIPLSDLEGGSSGGDVYGGLISANRLPGPNQGQQGVFGAYPLATPKYAFNEGGRDSEFKETLARMYVSLSGVSGETKQAYVNSIPQGQVRGLAKVLAGTSDGSGTGFIDFFLQQVNESFQESVQVDKVLGDNYVAFYFGQEPPVFQYSGSLLNSQQDDQRSGFYLAYQHLVRGSMLARRNQLLRLRYDSVIVSGYIQSMSQSLNAENEMIVPFNFTLLVKEYLVLDTKKFVKLEPEQYVQLATKFSNEKLSKVERSSDIRIRSKVLPVEAPSAVSSAGPADVAAGATATGETLLKIADITLATIGTFGGAL